MEIDFDSSTLILLAKIELLREIAEEIKIRLITDYGAKDKPRLCGKVKTIRITIFG